MINMQGDSMKNKQEFNGLQSESTRRVLIIALAACFAAAAMVLAGCPGDFSIGIQQSYSPPFSVDGLQPGDADGSIPIPHARILKLTTIGENDMIDAANTTDPPASENWPSIIGRDIKGDDRKVERWQFVITWERDGPKTEDQLKAAVTDVYNEWLKWKNQFDPLPYFYAGVEPKYAGPNVDYSAGATKMGTADSPKKINQSDTLTINFARYWPPKSVTGPKNLTPYLSWHSWEEQKSVSLPLRLAAYRAVKADIAAINADIESSPIYGLEITVGGETFAGLDRVNMALKRVVKEGLGPVGNGLVFPPTANLPFRWNDEDTGDIKGQIIILDETYSGRLYEAYFGHVPSAGGYSNGKLTYPAN
jgi:hypothetical protein